MKPRTKQILSSGTGDAEAGMTLAELVVYMMLLVIVLGMATVLFINVLRIQSEVTVMAQENNDGQQLYDQLERDLRNAAWVEVGADGDLAVMRTRVEQDGSTLVNSQCVAYYYDDADATLSWRRTSESDPDPVTDLLGKSEAALTTEAASWPRNQDDLGRIAGERVFGSADARYDSHSPSIGVRLVANDSSERKSVVFDKSVTLRLQSDLVGGCA